MRDWITLAPPRGLGSSVEKIAQLLKATDEGIAALVEFDAELRRAPGGAREGAGRKPADAAKAEFALEPDEIKSDIIRLEKDGPKKGDSNYGTSAQSGLRRLDLAAKAGDDKAAELLDRVRDPNDPLTVNGACVAMGWRQPTRTVRDTPEGLSDAVVRKIGPR